MSRWVFIYESQSCHVGFLFISHNHVTLIALKQEKQMMYRDVCTTVTCMSQWYLKVMIMSRSLLYVCEKRVMYREVYISLIWSCIHMVMFICHDQVTLIAVCMWEESDV